MEFNIQSIIHTSGINCTYKAPFFEEGYSEAPAILAFVTENNVNASNQIPPTHDPEDQYTDIAPASVVALVMDPEGELPEERHVIDPGKDGHFYLTIGEEEYSLTGSNMLEIREKINLMESDGEFICQDQHKARESINEVFDIIRENPNTEGMPYQMIEKAYVASMIDQFNDTEIPITIDELARKSRADSLKVRIGKIDPDHPDAIQNTSDLPNILQDSGIEMSMSGIGATVRNFGPAINSQKDLNRMMILANEKLCQSLFGNMTTTPLEQISCGLISLDDFESLRVRKGNQFLTGDWVERMHKTTRSILQRGMPGYHFESEIYSEDGRDILLVSDAPGQQRNMAYVYSWPSSERISISEIDETKRMNISPEEIPDEDEINRLSDILLELQGMNAPEYDEEDEEFDDRMDQLFHLTSGEGEDDLIDDEDDFRL